MRILFVAVSTDPFKDFFSGTAQRTHFLLKACSVYAQTDVCAFVSGVVSDIQDCNVVFSSDIRDSGIQYSSFTKRMAVMFGKPNPESLYCVNQTRAEVIDNLISKYNYDYIVVRYMEVAISCGLFKYAERLVIDVDDNPVMSHKMRISLKRGLSRLFPVLRTVPDKRVFKYVQRKCRFTFFSNPVESKYSKSSYLPNLPLLKSDTVREGLKDVLFFVGALNYEPNRQGITRFIVNVWPFLKTQRPSLRLRIAGLCDNERLIEKWRSYPDVEYLGFVEDIRQEYLNCKIVIAPIYKGTGTNIKVLEALAMGKVCVTTSTGIRGFDGVLTPGKELFVADSDEQFSSLILKMLDNDLLRREVGHNAIETIENNFNEDVFTQMFSKCFVEQ